MKTPIIITKTKKNTLIEMIEYLTAYMCHWIHNSSQTFKLYTITL